MNNDEIILDVTYQIDPTIKSWMSYIKSLIYHLPCSKNQAFLNFSIVTRNRSITSNCNNVSNQNAITSFNLLHTSLIVNEINVLSIDYFIASS